MNSEQFWKRIISKDSRPVLIAEGGVNYYEIAKTRGLSLLEAAKLMVDEAAENGADVFKVQMYKAKTLASRYARAYWDTRKEPTRSQYELFSKYDKLREKEYRELAAHCKKRGILFNASAWDEEMVDVVDELSPFFKIASADLTNFPLIARIARKRKPVVLSIGGATFEEVRKTVRFLEKRGATRIALLHCILNYPAQYENAKLDTIPFMKKMFPKYAIGYSDHMPPDPNMALVTAAVLLGARVVEKHFTLDKTLQGNDHYHSMDAQDLKKISENLDLLGKVRGIRKAPLPSEKNSIKFARRSVVILRDMQKGERIRRSDVTTKRPGTGIAPEFIEELAGRTLHRSVKEDQILQWKDIS